MKSFSNCLQPTSGGGGEIKMVLRIFIVCMDLLLMFIRERQKTLDDDLKKKQLLVLLLSTHGGLSDILGMLKLFSVELVGP